MTLVLVFLSILGIFLSGILLFFNARKNVSTVYLGVFFLLVSLYGLYQYVLIYSKSVLLVSIFLVNLAITSAPLYLIGPMLFWYTRSVLTDDFQLKKSDFWHLLPMIVYFIAAFPYSFVPWADKMEAAKEVVRNVGFMQSYKATILSEVFPVSAIFLSRPVLVLVYTLWSAGLYIRYVRQGKVSAVFSRQYFMTKWLWLLLGFTFILVISHILLVIRIFAMEFSALFFTLNVLRVLSGAGLIGLLISPFFFPAVLYGLPRIPETVVPLKTGMAETNQLPEEARKDTSHFESDYIHSISWKVDSYMNDFQPYLRPDFNLAHFSVQIQIPLHHLGYYFREVKNQHFNDYRNEWRINHAKNLIKEGKAKELTLEAIGKLSGFSSRNTFRTTFEKMEGITPSIFVAQIIE